MQEDYELSGYQREYKRENNYTPESKEDEGHKELRELGKDKSIQYQEKAKKDITINLTLPLVFLAGMYVGVGMMHYKIMNNELREQMQREEYRLKREEYRLNFNFEEFMRKHGAGITSMIGGS